MVVDAAGNFPLDQKPRCFLPVIVKRRNLVLWNSFSIPTPKGTKYFFPVEFLSFEILQDFCVPNDP
jgi:hypothetical protein